MYKFETHTVIINNPNEWIEIECKLPIRNQVQLINQGINNDMISEVIIDVIIHEKENFNVNMYQTGVRLGLRDYIEDFISKDVGIWVKSSVAGATICVLEKGYV